MNAPPGQVNDLTQRISRKLQIRRGMHLTYNDLALLVASGAFGALQQATEKEFNEQCLSQLEKPAETKPLKPRQQRSKFLAHSH